MTTIHYSMGEPRECIIQIWEDLHNERANYYRAFWCDGPGATSGSPVIGYCSAGGSHRTIKAAIAECRRLGYTDPVYRNGKLIAA